MALQLLLWLGVAVLVVIFLTVVTPIHVALSWQSDPARPSTILLRLFGGVLPAIKVYDSSKRPAVRKKAAEKKKPDRKVRRRGAGGQASGDILAEAMGLVQRLLVAIKIDDLRLDAQVGLGDPGATGQLYGQLCPLIYATGGHVRLRPNFDAACLEGAALARLHFTLWGLIWPCVRFGWRVFGPVR